MKKIMPILIVLIIAGGGIFLLVRNANKPGMYDTFAQCLSDSGAKFYGAFWCPHCQATKALFGRSAKLLPYVECSTPDGKNQLPICKDAGVEGYPTWVFSDGSRLSGEQTFQELSEKTNCAVN